MLRTPAAPDAAEAASMGLVPAGAYRNREYLKTVTIDPSVPSNIEDLCYDPQTSGGLLLSVPAGIAKDVLLALKETGSTQAAVIGEVLEKGKGEIYVD